MKLFNVSLIQNSSQVDAYSSYLLHASYTQMGVYFSELFNLPIGALWTAVVGEWELDAGGRGSARLPVEKVILHERFNNYVHDIGESI